MIINTDGSITTQNLAPAGVATAGSAVEIVLSGDANTLTIQTTGTYTGALSLQGTIDGVTWVTLGGTQLQNINTGAFASTIASAVQGIFQSNVSGFTKARITGLAAMTGTVKVSLSASNSSALVGVGAPLPAGSQTIGTVSLGVGGTGASSLGKAEDAVHASGDTGVAVFGVQYPTLTTPNASGDYTFLQADDLAKLVNMPYAPTVNQVQGITAAMTGTASTSVVASAGAGVRNYVTGVTITNTHATVGTEVQILDGATILDRIYVPALKTESKTYLTPLKGTAATAINAQNITTGSNTYVQVVGFKAL